MRQIGLCVLTAVTLLLGVGEASAQPPAPQKVESPNVKVLTGLYAQQFQEEMNLIVQGLGVSCGFCHTRNNFAAEDNPNKITARRMLEMSKAINQQFFPDYKPQDGDSVLGKVNCYACHKGEQKPKLAPGF